jgi:branched-subunit amino acid ABC-type transport system permease component
MNNENWAIASALATLMSFGVVLAGLLFSFGATKSYQFALGELSMFTAMLYVILAAVDSERKIRLGMLHTGAVAWFACGAISFGLATWRY